MITDGREFDCNIFFSGGAGMFIQYHDIVKPVWLYAIAKLMLNDNLFGIPASILTKFSYGSIVEWYINRRYVNPIKSLDYQNKLDIEELDDLMHTILLEDNTIYKCAPVLNIDKMLSVYKQQHMSFPIFIYSTEYEPYIEQDCRNIFPGISFTYLYGDLYNAISKCEENFTYIFSNIELVNQACSILNGTYSNIVLPMDYRYNYNGRRFKYNLRELAATHPYIRIQLNSVIDQISVTKSFANK